GYPWSRTIRGFYRHPPEQCNHLYDGGNIVQPRRNPETHPRRRRPERNDTTLRWFWLQAQSRRRYRPAMPCERYASSMILHDTAAPVNHQTHEPAAGYNECTQLCRPTPN